MKTVLKPTQDKCKSLNRKCFILKPVQRKSGSTVSPKDEIKKKKKKLLAEYKRITIKMRPLFALLPQFEKVCKNRCNYLVDSCFKDYVFENEDEETGESSDDDITESHEKVIDLIYTIKLCGYNLTTLNVTNYPFSEILPLINSNCPNIETLSLAFKNVKSRDFNNAFSNMSHLDSLKIQWRCEYSIPSQFLVKSLEKVGGTLQHLFLERFTDGFSSQLPYSMASIIRGFVVLKRLHMYGFGLTQSLLQSIGQLQSLVDISITYMWSKYEKLSNPINMYPIGNLKNLEMLLIYFDCGVTDEFLINLSKNAKKLETLLIVDTHITDRGKNALKKVKGLRVAYVH